MTLKEESNELLKSLNKEQSSNKMDLPFKNKGFSLLEKYIDREAFTSLSKGISTDANGEKTSVLTDPIMSQEQFIEIKKKISLTRTTCILDCLIEIKDSLDFLSFDLNYLASLDDEALASFNKNKTSNPETTSMASEGLEVKDQKSTIQ